MTWWAVDVVVARDTSAQVARWLAAETGQAVEERSDGSLAAAVPDEAHAGRISQLIGEQWAGATATVRRLPDTDWSLEWRRGLAPRTIGDLVVAPSWAMPDAGHPGNTIVLDPGMAFGSGEHGSTRAALRLMQGRDLRGRNVFDLGSGSGILSLAAVRLGASSAVGIEMEPAAVEVAEENARTNGIAAVRFIAGDAAALLPLLGRADLIASNILRQPNIELLPLIAPALEPGGAAIFSGMEESEAPLFLPHLQSAGLTAVEQLTDEGWWAVTAVPC